MFNKNFRDDIFFRNVRQPEVEMFFSLFRPSQIKATRTIVAVKDSSISKEFVLEKAHSEGPRNRTSRLKDENGKRVLGKGATSQQDGWFGGAL